MKRQLIPLTIGLNPFASSSKIAEQLQTPILFISNPLKEKSLAVTAAPARPPPAMRGSGGGGMFQQTNVPGDAVDLSANWPVVGEGKEAR